MLCFRLSANGISIALTDLPATCYYFRPIFALSSQDEQQSPTIAYQRRGRRPRRWRRRTGRSGALAGAKRSQRRCGVGSGGASRGYGSAERGNGGGGATQHGAEPVQSQPSGIPPICSGAGPEAGCGVHSAQRAESPADAVRSTTNAVRPDAASVDHAGLLPGQSVRPATDDVAVHAVPFPDHGAVLPAGARPAGQGADAWMGPAATGRPPTTDGASGTPAPPSSNSSGNSHQSAGASSSGQSDRDRADPPRLPARPSSDLSDVSDAERDRSPSPTPATEPAEILKSQSRRHPHHHMLQLRLNQPQPARLQRAEKDEVIRQCKNCRTVSRDVLNSSKCLSTW